MSSPWLAWPAGTDPRRLSRSLHLAHEQFLTSGRTPRGLRPVVAASWRRSARSGVDTDSALPPVDLLDADLEAYRTAHPLARAMPLIRRLLVEDAADAGMIVAVTDASGRLLWVEGDARLRSEAAAMHFLEGAAWDEAHAGTNAPGVAIALDHAVQVFAAEHFSRAAQPWSCSAAPIHAPGSGELLGVIDVTGGDEVASPSTLALVRAAAAAVEGELRLRPLAPDHLDTRRRRRTQYAAPWLSVLGRSNAVLEHGGARTRLSPRHGELLLLIAMAPGGLTAEELSVALHEHEASPVTVRVELSRLRPLLGDLGLTSRPYRLERPLGTDADLVRQHLDRGRIAEALDLYAGPVLPRSSAPGVATVRDDLESRLRATLIGQSSLALLLRYGRTPAGRTDHRVWQACRDRAPAGSADRAEIVARLARIDAEYGSRS